MDGGGSLGSSPRGATRHSDYMRGVGGGGRSAHQGLAGEAGPLVKGAALLLCPTTITLYNPICLGEMIQIMNAWNGGQLRWQVR